MSSATERHYCLQLTVFWIDLLLLLPESASDADKRIEKQAWRFVRSDESKWSPLKSEAHSMFETGDCCEL